MKVNYLSTMSNWLNQIENHKGWYIAGFVDGEGSFNVSLRKRTDHKLKWQVILTFNVAQKDLTVLHLIKTSLSCGRIQTRKDGVSMFIVQNPTSIYEKVIPFFKKFHFLSSSKKSNFSIFCQIAELMLDSPLTQSNFNKVLELREKLNPGIGRKRKHTLSSITQISSTTTCQT